MATNCTPFVAYLYCFVVFFVVVQFGVFYERKFMLSQADII